MKVIDIVVRSSDYLTSQYKSLNDANKDKSTKPTDEPQKPLNWFKVRPRVKVLGFDNKRAGWAYEITYVITAYPVATVETPDFSNIFTSTGCFTLHKEYDFWFTGRNTDVLDFKQEYNSLYLTTFNSKHMIDPNINPAQQTNFRALRAYRPTSGQQGVGEKLEDEQAANAASVLYAPGDIASCDVDIVGDPDWLSQSELFYAATIEPQQRLLPDSSVNYDMAEVFFSVNFNTVVDYSLDTGLADVTTQNVGANLDNAPPEGVSQYAFVYRANTVVSQFAKGKFVQKLNGTLVFLPEACVTGQAPVQRPDQPPTT